MDNQAEEENENENNSKDPLNPDGTVQPEKEETFSLEGLFAKKADVILLGPLPVAIYAVVVVCGGELVLSSASTSCSLDGIAAPEIDYLVATITIAIWIGQIFLLHFAWTILGFRVEFSRDFFRRKGRWGFLSVFGYTCKPANSFDPWTKTRGTICIFRPYQSITFVAAVYLLLLILYIAVMGFGFFSTFAASAICGTQTPIVISFGTFMVYSFWIFAFLAAFGLFMNVCGSRITRSVKKAKKAVKDTAYPTQDRIVVSEFKKLDRDGNNTMETDELKTLLSNLQLDLSDEEVENVKKEIDGDNSGSISLEEFLKWYHAADNGEDSSDQSGDEDDSDDESGEENPAKE